MFGCNIKGLSPLLDQPVETVADDLMVFEPAVGREPRHRGAHHAAVDIDVAKNFSTVPSQTEPPRGTMASPNSVMTMKPVREGSRLSWSMMRAGGCGMLNA